MSGLNDTIKGPSTSLHRDLQPSVIRKDNDDIIKKMVDIILDRYGNPFAIDVSDDASSDDPYPLVNIATGAVTLPDILKSLLTAKEIRKSALMEHMEQRLDAEKVALQEPLKRRKLPTCITIDSSGKSKEVVKTQSIDSGRQPFVRMLVICVQRPTNTPSKVF